MGAHSYRRSKDTRGRPAQPAGVPGPLNPGCRIKSAGRKANRILLLSIILQKIPGAFFHERAEALGPGPGLLALLIRMPTSRKNVADNAAEQIYEAGVVEVAAERGSVGEQCAIADLQGIRRPPLLVEKNHDVPPFSYQKQSLVA